MRYNLPDRVFRELTTLAQKYSVMKIILFGSRARGTHTERSDIDIVVYGGDFDNFYWDVKENIYSLLIFDIIQADAPISDTLKEEIKKDGITIYENKPKSLTTSIFQNQESQHPPVLHNEELCTLPTTIRPVENTGEGCAEGTAKSPWRLFSASQANISSS